MAYSIDLRKKALKYRRNHSLRDTSEKFDVSITTIMDWENLLKVTGSLEKRQLNRSFKKIDPIELERFVAENPDAFLREIAAFFSCSIQSVKEALDKQKITKKKLKFVIAKQMKRKEQSLR